MPIGTIKYPPGFALGDTVIGNSRFYVVNPKMPRGRTGKVTNGTAKPNQIRVLWRGCKGDVEVDSRLLNIVRKARHEPTTLPQGKTYDRIGPPQW